MSRRSYKEQQEEVLEDPCELVVTPAEEPEVNSEEESEVVDETPTKIPAEISMEVLDELLQPSDKDGVPEQETPIESEEPIPIQDVKPENTKINLNTSKEMEKVKKEEVEREIEIPKNSNKIVGIPKRSAFYKKLKGGARRTH